MAPVGTPVDRTSADTRRIILDCVLSGVVFVYRSADGGLVLHVRLSGRGVDSSDLTYELRTFNFEVLKIYLFGYGTRGCGV